MNIRIVEESIFASHLGSKTPRGSLRFLERAHAPYRLEHVNAAAVAPARPAYLKSGISNRQAAKLTATVTPVTPTAPFGILLAYIALSMTVLLAIPGRPRPYIARAVPVACQAHSVKAPLKNSICTVSWERTKSPTDTGRITKRLNLSASLIKSLNPALSFGSCLESMGRTACEIAMTKSPSGS